ncbi:MAG: aminopeptidase P family protein [Alphaproteobacteria bacterium]|nr:aminopeptidase P family protein [Alphaproteobacteria bacterium]
MSIKSIQEHLQKNNLHGQIITMSNLFIAQDIRDDENKIKELTNFTGSTALLFVTQKNAYLFVDGRYILQAKKETNPKLIELILQDDEAFCSLSKTLKKLYKNSSATILYNPWEISEQTKLFLQKELPNINFSSVPNPSYNLTQTIAKTFTHQKKFTGLSTNEKLTFVLNYMKQQKIDNYLITSPANASWLLNMRSNALKHSPVFRAYVLINKTGTCKVFANSTNYTKALPLEALEDTLKNTPKLATDYRTTPSIIIDFAPSIQNYKDPIENLKSIKNPTELKGFEQAHIRDGVAVTKFLYWLSKNYSQKTELDIAQKLTSLRQEEKNYYSDSFNTISAFGANGAIVHYAPTPKNNLTLKKGSLLLLDSGAQYYDGTTDITRTISIGKPTEDMKQNYTLVLKSHISLATAVFPEGTSGEKLDILARNSLLQHNLNYAHGTGHGVGHFSNVHEGPFRISINSNSNIPLQKGMVTSIEPGYYKENHYGIRIENLYQIIKYQKTPYLTFKALTLVPFDKNLILKDLLTNEEIDYINTYHQQVFNNLKKYLSRLELDWLKDKTSPI